MKTHTAPESPASVRPAAHLEQEVLEPSYYPAPDSCEMRLRDTFPAAHRRCSARSLQNKQQTGRHAANDTFIKRQRFWGFVICFCGPLRVLCCSAGVTASGGSKSRSSLCFGMLSISIWPSSFTARWFSKLCAVSPRLVSDIKCVRWITGLSAGNRTSLLPCFSLS